MFAKVQVATLLSWLFIVVVQTGLYLVILAALAGFAVRALIELHKAGVI